MSPEPPVALFWGEDAFLLRLAAHEFMRRHGVEFTEVSAREWRGGEMADLATPSLWGERRGLLITGFQSLPEAAVAEVRSYVKAPSTESVLALTATSRGKSAPAVAKAIQAGGGAVRQIAVKRQDVPRWVLDRAKGRGVTMTGPGAAALVGTLGEDFAALDQAVEQLATAFAGRSIGPGEVGAQFEGLGEQRVWDLCDRAFSGDLPAAMVVLRGLLDARQDPLFIVGAIASRVRELIRVRALPPGVPPAEAARATGVRFDWQLRRYRDQAKRFRSLDDLTELHGLVADADRAVKGGVPGDVVLPSLLAAIAGERDAALRVEVRASR